jgi:hypothetical protein
MAEQVIEYALIIAENCFDEGIFFVQFDIGHKHPTTADS